MAEIIIKGEIHTSESDLAEERELLVAGADALVIEGGREDAEYGAIRSWYATAMSLVGLVLFETLYTDHRILKDLGEAQDAEIYSTRQSDADLVENATIPLEILAAVSFYGLFILSVAWGLSTGDTLTGSILLLGAAIVPVYILRRHEMHRDSNELNRDQQMADKIVEATGDGERVVAIVGGNHIDGIVSKLPEHVEPDIRRPAYRLFSLQHAKEIATPAFTAFSVLFVLYLIILELFRWLLIFV